MTATDPMRNIRIAMENGTLGRSGFGGCLGFFGRATFGP
jgi:hypothetical protein